jgi:hypothetical protein
VRLAQVAAFLVLFAALALKTLGLVFEFAVSTSAVVITISISAIVGLICMLSELPENAPKRDRAIIIWAIVLAALVLIAVFAMLVFDLIETPVS